MLEHACTLQKSRINLGLCSIALWKHLQGFGRRTLLVAQKVSEHCGIPSGKGHKDVSDLHLPNTNNNGLDTQVFGG